jgi:hypothetical protein
MTDLSERLHRAVPEDQPLPDLDRLRDRASSRNTAHQRFRFGAVICAALLLVGGTLALRNQASHSTSASSPAQPTSSTDVEEFTSSPADTGPCYQGLSGIVFGGTYGDGLCLAVAPPSEDGTMVWFVADGTNNGGTRFQACSKTPADVIKSIGDPATGPSFFVVAADVTSLSIPLDSGSSLTAKTVSVAGIDGVRFAATRYPADASVSGPISLKTDPLGGTVECTAP